MARTYTFKGNGANYFAYIEDGQLVIGEDWGREGGILYKGTFDSKDADKHLAMLRKNSPKLYESILRYYAPRGGGLGLRANAPKLANSIDKYYFDEAEKPKKISESPAEEETITHQFKDSRDLHGYGYSGYIEKGQLVLCYEAPREGGVYYRGNYEGAGCELRNLKTYDPVLYDDIEKWFTKHGVKDESDRKDLSGNKETKYTVRLFMNNGKEFNAVISGESETDVIRKIMLPVPDTVMMYDLEGRTMAVRSDKIYTVAILD